MYGTELYSNSDTLGSCTACPYDPNALIPSTCDPTTGFSLSCYPDYYTNAETGGVCTPCNTLSDYLSSDNTYDATTGVSLDCLPGNYPITIRCQSGLISWGCVPREICDPNSDGTCDPTTGFSLVCITLGTGITSDETCETCPFGQVVVNNLCTFCTSGTFFSAQNCIACSQFSHGAILCDPVSGAALSVFPE